MESEKKTKREQAIKEKIVQKPSNKKEMEAEAQRRLNAEVAHQTEEAETRALGRAMMADANSNRPSFSNSSLKLLNNFQGD